MKKLTFIFDLDGTLIDSFNQIIDCATRVRELFQMKFIAKADLANLVGLSADQLFSDNPPTVVTKAVTTFRHELSREIERGNVPYVGAVELLRKLKGESIQTAIATSKPHTLAQLVVSKSPLDSLIDHIQGIDGFAPKPDPEVVFRCQIKLPADRFVMVGDRPEDIFAGLNSGCISVGIAQGSFREEQLKEAGAHETFPSVDHLSMDLYDFLSRLKIYG